MDFNEVVLLFAKKHGIIAGVCDAKPLDPRRFAGFTPFVSSVTEKRINPETALKSAKSIVAVGVGCPVSSLKPTGNAEISALGIDYDYHLRVKNILNKLIDEITKHTKFRHRILVDKHLLCERSFAWRAGIGFFGKNGLIISKEFGTRFNIGLLVTDIPFSGNNENTETCPSGCSLCINACPTGALSPFDSRLCISYLTQKEELTPREKKLVGKQLYGCDICQNVCRFNPPHSGYFIDHNEWISLSDSQLEDKYKHTAMWWRGAEILRRNANIVKNNE